MREHGIDYLSLEWIKVADNLYSHQSTITTTAKSQRLGHQPCVVWLTGLSGSGKSTLANALERRLFVLGCRTHILDGDNVRLGLNSDLGFSPEDRQENIRRIGEVANLFAESGAIIITAFISPYQADRQRARFATHQPFFEVHVSAGLDTCEERDPKGLYKKARAGIIKGFTGIDAPYEIPRNADVTVHTDTQSVEQCVNRIIDCLTSNQIL